MSHRVPLWPRLCETRLNRTYNRPSLVLRRAKRIWPLWTRRWRRPRPWRRCTSRSWWRCRRWGCCGGGRRSWRCCASGCRRWRCCGGGRRSSRCCRCWRWRSTSLAEPFCRVCWYASGIIAACQPNPGRAVSVGGEVAPRVGERWNGRIYCPTVRDRIISIHFVGWVGRGSSTTHHEHFAVEVKRPRLSCRSRYGGNRADRIRHRVINKGVGRIGKKTSRNIAAPTRIDEAADGRGGYVTQRNRQNSGLLYPGGREE